MSTAPLTAAYLATTYRVEADAPGEPIALHVGERSGALDRLLKRRGVRVWAFVTACNPRSRRLPPWQNLVRQRRLTALARRLGFAAVPATGVGDDPDWIPEPSALILGISCARARRLARLFDQNAIVAGRRGGAPELVWCSNS